MSCVLTPIGNNIVQIGVYDNGDSYIHIRAGNLMQPGISCDTTADLPAQAGGITGYYLEQGSTAHVIADNTLYAIDSSGNWIIQDEASRMDVYTKSQVDSIVNGINTDISNVRRDISDIQNVLANIIDCNAKNILNVWGQTSQSISGIQWTINNDGSIRANGLATANSILYIWRNAFTPPAIDYDITIDGLPAGASDSTYDFVYTSTAGGSISITDTRQISQVIASTTTRFALRVYSGQNVDITFRPMICRSSFYSLTNNFVPYSPTNAELAAMIRSYHP